MFSVPLGMMYGADVRAQPFTPCNVSLTPYPSLQLSTAEYIRKSLIASYLGNIVGALFVGLPALYWYLTDYHFTDTEMRELEAGGASPRPAPSHDGTVQEIFRVESKRS